MIFIRILFVLGIGALTAWGKPAQVILLRHAEKPPEITNPHLSPRGEERARALIQWFTNTPEVTVHGPPVALFATMPKNHGGGVRSGETLQPLAKFLNMRIQTPYIATNHSQLVKDILSRPEYDGKTVVVCWVHTSLPEIARELGAKSVPKSWKEDVFDRAWIVRFTEKKTKFLELNQHLLPGDAK